TASSTTERNRPPKRNLMSPPSPPEVMAGERRACRRSPQPAQRELYTNVARGQVGAPSPLMPRVAEAACIGWPEWARLGSNQRPPACELPRTLAIRGHHWPERDDLGVSAPRTSLLRPSVSPSRFQLASSLFPVSQVSRPRPRRPVR